MDIEQPPLDLPDDVREYLTRQLRNVDIKASAPILTSDITNGAVTTEKIANGAITTDKIANGAITQPKLSVGVCGNGPSLCAYQDVTQLLPAATATKIHLQAKEWDTAIRFDNIVNYRFTPDISGYYQVSGRVAVATTATTVYLWIYRNGTEHRALGSQAPNITAISGSAIVFLNGLNDYIELFAYSLVAQNTAIGPGTTYFQAAMIRSV
jgi:hypothetical protein